MIWCTWPARLIQRTIFSTDDASKLPWLERSSIEPQQTGANPEALWKDVRCNSSPIRKTRFQHQHFTFQPFLGGCFFGFQLFGVGVSAALAASWLETRTLPQSLPRPATCPGPNEWSSESGNPVGDQCCSNWKTRRGCHLAQCLMRCPISDWCFGIDVFVQACSNPVQPIIGEWYWMIRLCCQKRRKPYDFTDFSSWVYTFAPSPCDVFGVLGSWCFCYIYSLPCSIPAWDDSP